MHIQTKRAGLPRLAGDPFDMPAAGLAIRIADAVTAHFERQVARSELHALSDRELADIGIAREDIDPALARWNGLR